MQVTCAQCGFVFRSHPSWHRRADGQIMCSRDCAIKWEARQKPKPRRPRTVSWEHRYFWPKVKRGKGCWEWQGARNPLGYGRSVAAQRRGYSQLAHRVAYALLRGPIPPDLDIHHECHTPRCCNPDHMTLMTTGDHLRLVLPAIHAAQRGKRQSPNATCRRGHLMDETNTAYLANGARRCGACRALNSRDSYWRKRGYRDYADWLESQGGPSYV